MEQRVTVEMIGQAIREADSKQLGRWSFYTLKLLSESLNARIFGDRPGHCPTCHSPQAHLHPAVQHEGEVQPCENSWHYPDRPASPRKMTTKEHKTMQKILKTSSSLDPYPGWRR